MVLHYTILDVRHTICLLELDGLDLVSRVYIGYCGPFPYSHYLSFGTDSYFKWLKVEITDNLGRKLR